MCFCFLNLPKTSETQNIVTPSLDKQKPGYYSFLVCSSLGSCTFDILPVVAALSRYTVKSSHLLRPLLGMFQTIITGFHKIIFVKEEF